MGQRSCTGLLAALNRALKWGNRRAGLLFIFGLLGVGFHQWRLWQADKRRLALITLPPPRPDLEDWPRLPLVSALVAAWNEEEHIQNHIRSFQALRYPHKQLVLVAGGDDDTLSLARQKAGPDVLVLEQHPGEGKQHALLKGFELTTGEIIYLTDADCLLDDDSFERVVFPLAAGHEQAVTGTSYPGPTQSQNPFVFSQAASQLYGAYHASEYSPGLLGRNCALTRDAIILSGGLLAEAPTGTDYVLAKKLTAAGFPIRQLPESRIESVFPNSIRAYARQQERWIWNVWSYGRRLGAPNEARQMALNVAVGFGMMAAPPLALFVGPFWLATWGLLIIKGCTARARYFGFLAHLSSKMISLDNFLRIPFYLLLDLIIWARTLRLIVGNQQREGW